MRALARQFCKYSLVVNLRWQKRRQDPLGEEQDVADKYRIKHELVTQEKLRSVQSLIIKTAGDAT